jgi:hypothetical protein
MARYRVTLRVQPVSSCALSASRVVNARCAQAAACLLAAPYLDLGLAVDWSVRRTGISRLGQHWSGHFDAGDDDDGSAGVREPRRPHPPAGSANAFAL